MEDQRKDFDWFIEHYAELFSLYGKSFLVIKGGKVIGKYNSYAEGVQNTKETPGTFIIQECDGTEDAYTEIFSGVCV